MTKQKKWIQRTKHEFRCYYCKILCSDLNSLRIHTKFCVDNKHIHQNVIAHQTILGNTSPLQGMIGTNVDLTIVGSGFKNPAKVTFTKGIEGLECVNAVTNSATQITCVLTIPQGTTRGLWKITVINIGDQQSYTLSSRFLITNPTTAMPTHTQT